MRLALVAKEERRATTPSAAIGQRKILLIVPAKPIERFRAVLASSAINSGGITFVSLLYNQEKEGKK